LRAAGSRTKANRGERTLSPGPIVPVATAATPNIAVISLSGPKPNRSGGQRPNGWAEYGPQIDNLRAELDWAFSPDGEASIAVNLTAAAVPLWMHLSLMEECSGRVERALSALGAGANRGARHEMQLHAVLVTSRILTRGADTPEVSAAWTKARQIPACSFPAPGEPTGNWRSSNSRREAAAFVRWHEPDDARVSSPDHSGIANSLDDAEYQSRALWGLWSFHIDNGQGGGALDEPGVSR
jgi:hypothetical protein